MFSYLVTTGWIFDIISLLLLLFLTFSVLVGNPKKTTLHGGQSRSWFAEQGKENKRENLAARHPPHPARLCENSAIDQIRGGGILNLSLHPHPNRHRRPRRCERLPTSSKTSCVRLSVAVSFHHRQGGFKLRKFHAFLLFRALEGTFKSAFEAKNLCP